MRQQHMLLAKGLIARGDKAKALKVLDKTLEQFPDSKIYFDKFDMQLATQYFDAGNIKKGEEILNKITDLYINDVKYYNRFTGNKARSVASTKNEALQILALINNYAKDYNIQSVQKRISAIAEMQSLLGVQELQKGYNDLVNSINASLEVVRSGNKVEGANQLVAELTSLEKIMATQSQELFDRASELLMFVYSNAVNHQLKAVQDKIMSNPTFMKILQEASSKQQAQQVQGQQQNNINIPGVN